MEKYQLVIASSLIGAIVSYIGALIKNILETKTKINEALLEKRTGIYKDLWKLTKEIPKWPRNSNVTYKILEDLSRKLCDWYFDEGGIYLSSKAQKSYRDLQENIWKVIKENKKEDKISEKEYDSIRDKCSMLRTRVTKDLLSRKRAPIA